MVKPITPDEARKTSPTDFPSFVIEAFNKLIKENLRNESSSFGQTSVVAEMLDTYQGPWRTIRAQRKHIFEANWLDVEDLYRKAGWEVTYDKPAYNENYEPFFTFVKSKGR